MQTFLTDVTYTVHSSPYYQVLLMPFPQIGNRFALTAAHCLYDNVVDDDNNNNNTELLPASSFSIMLGLHDRSKDKEPNRWSCYLLLSRFKFGTFCTRKQIKVSKIVVHENFTGPINDIALLKLGEIIPGFQLCNKFTEDRVNLANFSPACLPSSGESFFDKKGHVYGE